jgi:hypothetical protein
MQAETQSLALERMIRRQRAEQFSSAPLLDNGGGDQSSRNDSCFAEVRSRLPLQISGTARNFVFPSSWGIRERGCFCAAQSMAACVWG